MKKEIKYTNDKYPMKPYSNPPITEALLDIRVTLPPDVNLSHLQEFQGVVKDIYPIRKERRHFEGGVQFKEGGAPELMPASNKVDGYLFHAQDGKSIVQARLDGFTFNKLRPYSNWEEFSAEAKRLWSEYVRISRPVNVTRLALRYINRIELPLPFADFKEYIQTIPEVADGIPNALEGFFLRLVIPNKDINAKAVVIETIEPPNGGKVCVPFILDIDVFSVGAFDPKSSEMWQVMDQLREFKNLIFDKSLTPKTKELFK